jgi:hypothetical protein
VTPRTTRIAAIAAASVLLALALLAPGSGHHRGGISSTPANATPPSRASGLHPLPRGRSTESEVRSSGASAQRQRRQALTTARAFLSVFLDYERGARTHARARALARTTTPALASQLRAAPARRPPGRPWPARARVRSLSVIGPADGRMKALATLRRGHGDEVLELHLRNGRGRWRVDGLG